MSATEFNDDPLFGLIAGHWAERTEGWQGRVADLAADLRDSIAANHTDYCECDW